MRFLNYLKYKNKLRLPVEFGHDIVPFEYKGPSSTFSMTPICTDRSVYTNIFTCLGEVNL